MNEKRQARKSFSNRTTSQTAETRVCSSDHPITRSSGRLLVVGCGNSYAADDNVGLEIVRRLQARGDCGCEFLELVGGSLGLMDSFENAELILLVDAVQSGAPTGTVHLLPLPSGNVAPRAMGRVSGHGWGLQDTLSLSQSLGLRIPRLMLLGIELGSVTLGFPRTPPVDDAVRVVVEFFPKLQAALSNAQSPLWTSHHSYPSNSIDFPRDFGPAV